LDKQYIFKIKFILFFIRSSYTQPDPKFVIFLFTPGFYTHIQFQSFIPSQNYLIKIINNVILQDFFYHYLIHIHSSFFVVHVIKVRILQYKLLLHFMFAI